MQVSAEVRRSTERGDFADLYFRAGCSWRGLVNTDAWLIRRSEHRIYIFGISLTGTSVNPARSIGPAVAALPNCKRSRRSARRQYISFRKMKA
ncbi:MAG TPA: aquaporin [Firmicutes bacterium]|nr:aquaporin [Bacillota bacterium]